ncbi:hypothetical protein GCM10027176_70730 [Actinoallomurus bryophytorum]
MRHPSGEDQHVPGPQVDRPAGELGRAPAREQDVERHLAGPADGIVQDEPLVKTVASTAHRWGFTHLGRFAAEYQTAYDELPSTTLRAVR